jgi:hypothetical protein
MHVFQDGVQRSGGFSIFVRTTNKDLLNFIVHNVVGGPALELFCQQCLYVHHLQCVFPMHWWFFNTGRYVL